MSISHIDFSEFYKNYLDKEDMQDQSSAVLLFGNGLFLSHPKKEVKEAYTLDNKEYKEIMETVNDEVRKVIGSKHALCPEDLLFSLRTIYGLYVFLKYLEKQKNLKRDFIPPTTFLNKFQSIYTTNFDINTYKIIFPPDNRNPSFVNGFRGENPITIGELKKRLTIEFKESNKFYFLHGTFPLLLNNSYKYLMIKSRNGEFTTTLIEEYKKLIDKFINEGDTPQARNPQEDIYDPHLNILRKNPLQSGSHKRGSIFKILLGSAFSGKVHLYFRMFI